MTTSANIPSGFWPHFQEYDLQSLDRNQDADLIIQRASWTTVERASERQAMQVGSHRLEYLWAGGTTNHARNVTTQAAGIVAGWRKRRLAPGEE